MEDHENDSSRGSLEGQDETHTTVSYSSRTPASSTLLLDDRPRQSYRSVFPPTSTARDDRPIYPFPSHLSQHESSVSPDNQAISPFQAEDFRQSDQYAVMPRYPSHPIQNLDSPQNFGHYPTCKYPLCTTQASPLTSPQQTIRGIQARWQSKGIQHSQIIRPPFLGTAVQKTELLQTLD
ncbi:hypothetical protein FRB91_002270 [Serendipita sp. 411]|nr:hypothetical protein FRB91_002270 [Serendipita sp. 411]